jgi:hypothetical protein
MHDANSKGALNYLSLAEEILKKNNIPLRTALPDSIRS